MIFIKRFCLLTRTPHTLQSTTLCNASIFPLRIKYESLRPSSSSSSSVPATQDNELFTTYSEEDVRKLKFIQLEISLRYENVPDMNLLKKHHSDELMKLESKSARRKYYTCLFVAEKAKQNKALRKQMKKEIRESQQALDPPQKSPHIGYALGYTSFLLRVESPVMNLWRNNRLFRAMQFGEKLIFDCSYDDHMSDREASHAAKQLTLAFASNRKNREPFDLHFCNVNFSSVTMKHLERCVPTMRHNGFPMNLHEVSYVDLFPHQQLTYLTPHCQHELDTYDPDMVYIIGAMVDTRNNEPLSLAKAKKLNLKMARLPLDRYLNFGGGSGKSLTLDQMMNIMLDLKRTRSWEIALKHVPRRKLKSDPHEKMKKFFNQSKKFS